MYIVEYIIVGDIVGEAVNGLAADGGQLAPLQLNDAAFCSFVISVS